MACLLRKKSLAWILTKVRAACIASRDGIYVRGVHGAMACSGIRSVDVADDRDAGVVKHVAQLAH